MRTLAIEVAGSYCHQPITARRTAPSEWGSNAASGSLKSCWVKEALVEIGEGMLRRSRPHRHAPALVEQPLRDSDRLARHLELAPVGSIAEEGSGPWQTEI